MKLTKSERKNSNPTHVKLHTLWRSMMGRCYYEQNGSYANYGGRGVTVTPSWHTYDGFLETIDTVEGYDIDRMIRGELQLDKDVKGDGKTYSPTSCKLITPSENSGNRRTSKEIVAIHLKTSEVVVTRNREAFCREHSLDPSSIWRCLQKGKGVNKGWAIYYTDNFSMDMLPEKKRYLAVNEETREQVTFTNKRKFAISKDLNVASISSVLAGRQRRVGTWAITPLPSILYKDSTTIERQLITLGVISTNQVE